jgi:hypothetical protein
MWNSPILYSGYPYKKNRVSPDVPEMKMSYALTIIDMFTLGIFFQGARYNG